MLGFLKLRRQCGVSHEVRQGAQGASLMAPGKSGQRVSNEIKSLCAQDQLKVSVK